MRIYILSAEPKNFVPIELLKAAQAAGVDACIVDISKIVIDESLGGGALWAVNGEGLCPLPIDTETIIIPRLNEHHLDTKINILKKLENMGAKLLNSADGMELCNDKLMSQAVLNAAGIETPSSWVIQDGETFDLIVKQLEERKAISFPIIMKTFRGTHGIGVMKLDSKSSLVSVGQTLLKQGIAFMLQEFIEHDQSCRIIMKGPELLAANLRGQPTGKDEFRTNSHLGSETQPYNPCEEELVVGRRIVELFKTSFCAIDYIIVDSKENTIKEEADPVDTQLAPGRRIIVLEVNGSPGLEAMAKNWPERNLAAEVIDYAKLMVMPDSQATESADTPEADSLELIEPIIIHRVIDEPIGAKVDTGARTSSLHVDDIEIIGSMVKFRRADTIYRVPLVDIRHVKTHDDKGEAVERPIVALDATVHGVRVNSVEFSLIDRAHMQYQVLIGRNLISQLGLPVVIEPTSSDGMPASPAVQIDNSEEE